MSDAATTATWGYRPNGDAEIFHLAPGEDLPEGWHASPSVITDPSRATAEALSATIARNAETPRPAADVPRTVLDADATGAKVSHPSEVEEQIGALQTENARLAAEVAELRQALATSEAARAEAVERIVALTTQLEESRAASSASAIAEQAANPPDADEARASATPPARTRDEAREAVRALLGEELTDREIARRVGVSPSTVASVRKLEAEKAST